jgi:hypothetical protein
MIFFRPIKGFLMPHALLALPDVYESVTRRVAVDVTKQLARLMRLPGDTTVYLPGNSETVPMNGGTFGDCYDPKVKYPAEAHLTVRYNEELEEQHTLVTPVHNQEHFPLFHDEHRDIVMRPVYRYVALTVTLEYNAPSIVLVQRWLDEMRTRISMGRAELYQDLEYHFGLPPVALEILRHLHTTRESSTSPTGESFEDYLKAHLKVPVKTITSLADTGATLVFPEHQYEVLGWFDFTTSPNNPDKEEAGNYKATVTYTLRYNRPMQVYLRYPYLVHNKVVGRAFRPSEPYETFRKHGRRVSTTKGSFDGFLSFLKTHEIPYIQYPDTDDWVPDSVPKERLTFFTGLLALNPSDKRGLIDLSNLGEYTFKPYFLEYFYQQGQRLFGTTSSIFEFRLYENRVQRTDVQLSFKPGTVTIQTDRDLDLTRYYHIQISLRRNWYSVDTETLQCLRRYPTVMYYCLLALGYKLGEREYPALRLIGQGAPRPASPLCPGEGSLIGDPSKGGTWPWPWLPGEWGDIPWQGGDWESPYHSGVVTTTDMQKARDWTDAHAGDYIDRIRVGPPTVLYAEIIALKHNARS